MKLPSPNLNWSHSTCSIESLNKALSNDEISAIEVDIVMGYVKPSVTFILDDATIKTTHNAEEEGYNTIMPIMAHPPLKESDLTMKSFLYHTSFSQSIFDDDEKCHTRRKLKKHIKLDFKEMETIQPTLDAIKDMEFSFNGDGKENTVFLNADILSGPGMRYEEDTNINSDLFLQLCIDYVHEETPYALSLGWRTDCRSFRGYMKSDANAMIDLFHRYKLMDTFSGIVLAVNARVLVKNYKPLQHILSTFPNCQMLVWTANGEPAIPEMKINSIQRHFEKCNLMDRVGFDCKITPSLCYGIWCDMLVTLSSINFYAQKCRVPSFFNMRGGSKGKEV